MQAMQRFRTMISRQLKKKFAELVQISPQVAVAHSAYGSVLLSEGKQLAAIRELETARQLDPAEMTSIANLAHAYEQTSQFDKAISMYSSVMSQQIPLSAESYLDDAQLLTNAGRLDDAKRELTAATASLPADSSLQDALWSHLCAAA